MIGALEREAFVVLAIATYAALLLANLGGVMGGDGWLLFTAGREIAAHGIPASDPFTVWSGGGEWIDQQWLAQLLLYGAAALGGLKGALALNVVFLVGAFALALGAARSLGASSRAVTVVGLAGVVGVFPHSGVRAQSLAYPLFVAVLTLLAHARRHGSPRVLLVLPLLVVWANLHGSVLIGAGLVSLYAVLEVGAGLRREPRRLAPAVLGMLAIGPWLCVLASPYGWSLIEYYRTTVGNDAFYNLVGEWQPSSLPGQLPFFAIALGTVWLMGRSRDRLNSFESLVLLLTLVAGLAAVRNVVWFVLAVLVLLPLSVDGPRSAGQKRRTRLNVALGATAVALAAAMLAAAATKPASAYLDAYPAGAAEAVEKVAAGDPSVRVFANERFADWLIWRAPELEGRLAFDVRFELLSADEIRSIGEWRGRVGEDWASAADGYRVVVLDSQTERHISQALLRESGTRVLFRDAAATVLLRRTVA